MNRKIPAAKEPAGIFLPIGKMVKIYLIQVIKRYPRSFLHCTEYPGVRKAPEI